MAGKYSWPGRPVSLPAASCQPASSAPPPPQCAPKNSLPIRNPGPNRLPPRRSEHNAVSESRIYAKLGDDGSIGLLFGGRTTKANPAIKMVRSIDETAAALGHAHASSVDTALCEAILRAQRDLFVVAANARPGRLAPGVSHVSADMTTHAGGLIDQAVARRPLRPVFIVPGANITSAALDLARSIVRRAEHNLVTYEAHQGRDRPLNPQVRNYLNRVFDLHYVWSGVLPVTRGRRYPRNPGSDLT